MFSGAIISIPQGCQRSNSPTALPVGPPATLTATWQNLNEGFYIGLGSGADMTALCRKGKSNSFSWVDGDGSPRRVAFFLRVTRRRPVFTELEHNGHRIVTQGF